MTCEQASGRRGQHVRRGVTVVGLAAAVMAAATLPAAAGGWWTYPQLEDDELAIGESVTVTADVLFPTVEDAETAAGSGEYFAYLVRGIDEAALHDAMRVAQPDDWWSAPSERVRLAPLELGRNSSNLGGATATFVVPEVEPGFYDVMLCTTGCSQPLADVVPLRGIYVGDAVTVRALRDAQPATEHVLNELATVQSDLGRLRSDTETIDSELTDVDATLTDMNTSIQRLSAALATLETPTAEGERAGQRWWAGAGWLVAGAAVGGSVTWWRMRRRPAKRGGQENRNDPPDTVTRSSPGDRSGSEPDLVTFQLQ